MEEPAKKTRKRARDKYAELPVIPTNQVVPLACQIIDLQAGLDEAKKIVEDRPKILLKRKKIMMKTMESNGIDEISGIQHRGCFWNVEIVEKEVKKKWEKDDLIQAWMQKFNISHDSAEALYAFEHELYKEHSNTILIKKTGHAKRAVAATDMT